MTPEKDAALCKDFPHLFRDRNVSMMQTAFCWGFEHGDGWEKIIRSAAEKIEPIIVKMMDDAIKAKDEEALDYIPTTSQVKEKYGTLRWYMTCSTDEIDEIINEAEKKSETTCEQCGKKGKLRGDSWVYTACNDCHKKREKKKYGK